MTNSLARKSMAVAAIAAGVVLFGGGMAQAADSSTTTGRVVEHGHGIDLDLDQDSTNICGNVMSDDSIVAGNDADCDAVDLIIGG